MVDRISPREALRRMNEARWIYVDVRSVPEFELGHPASAYNVPLMHMVAGGMEPNPDFLSVMSSWFAKDAPLILGCKSGQRSLRAAELLTSAGFTNVVDQRAGWAGARDAFGRLVEPGWDAEGLPSSTEAEADHRYEHLAKTRG